MMLFPTIEVMNGKCVSLNRGRVDEPVIWHVDPVETARGFAEAGASWMHLTDIDALLGREGNDDLVREIIRAVGIPVQLGGGFRTRDRVAHWIDLGAGRIVIGTLATKNPKLVRELAKFYPDQIVLAVDIFQGQLMTDGWVNTCAFAPREFVRSFDGAPLAGIVVTDIDAHIEDSDAHLGTISALAAETPHPVIARGTVNSLDDIARLKYVHNVSGALVGRALFSRDIDLSEALAAAQPEPEKRAEFI